MCLMLYDIPCPGGKGRVGRRIGNLSLGVIRDIICLKKAQTGSTRWSVWMRKPLRVELSQHRRLDS